MTWDQAINMGILLSGFAGLLIPLHQANKKRAADNRAVLDKILTKLKSHDRRTRKIRQRQRVTMERLIKLERAQP